MFIARNICLYDVYVLFSFPVLFVTDLHVVTITILILPQSPKLGSLIRIHKFFGRNQAREEVSYLFFGCDDPASPSYPS